MGFEFQNVVQKYNFPIFYGICWAEKSHKKWEIVEFREFFSVSLYLLFFCCCTLCLFAVVAFYKISHFLFFSIAISALSPHIDTITTLFQCAACLFACCQPSFCSGLFDFCLFTSCLPAFLQYFPFFMGFFDKKIP